MILDLVLTGAAIALDPLPLTPFEWRNSSRVWSMSSQQGDDDSTAAKQGCGMKGTSSAR
jgi:hypothetical protein